MADPRVSRAIEIVKWALYSDPMSPTTMDWCEVIRTILKKNLTKEERVILIGVASGVPIKYYRKFHSTWITEIIKRASHTLVDAVEAEIAADVRLVKVRNNEEETNSGN